MKNTLEILICLEDVLEYVYSGLCEDNTLFFHDNTFEGLIKRCPDIRVISNYLDMIKNVICLLSEKVENFEDIYDNTHITNLNEEQIISIKNILSNLNLGDNLINYANMYF